MTDADGITGHTRGEWLLDRDLLQLRGTIRAASLTFGDGRHRQY